MRAEGGSRATPWSRHRILLAGSVVILVLAGIAGTSLTLPAPSATSVPFGAGPLPPSTADPLVADWSSTGSALLPLANVSYTLYQGSPSFPLAFGGNGSCGAFCNETLGFLNAQGAENWYDISPAHSPSPRADASLAWDPLLGGALLFGGVGPGGALNDTWLYVRASGWTALTPARSPPARYEAAMAYDPALGGVLLFGGQGPGGLQGDTWIFNGTTWTELSLPSAPSPRAGGSMGYDARTAAMVLFGGRGSAGFDADTWTFTGGNWTADPAALGPPARAGAALVVTGDGSPLLYGGVGPTGPLNDTWFLENMTWLPVTYAGGIGPPPLVGTSLTGNPSLGPNYFILMGGSGSSPGGLAPAWNLYAPFGGVPQGTQPLTAELTSSGSEGTAPFSVTFSATVQGGEAPYEFSWDFSDGSTASGSATEIHTFTHPGTYDVTLLVLDAAGDRTERTLTVTVRAPAPPSLLEFLGGPPVWALLVVVGGIAVWGVEGGVAELLRGRRLNRQVGSPPSRLARTATAAIRFAREPSPVALWGALRQIWSVRDMPTRSGWTRSPFLTWLLRRLLVAVPQVLVGVTLLYVLTEVVPSSVLPGPGSFVPGLGTFAQDLFTGNWGTVVLGSGRSFPAAELIRYYLPYSLELAFPALLLTALVSYPLGLYSGWQQGRAVDNTTRLFVAFAAFFPLLILALYFVDFLYGPFLHTFGDIPFGSLPSVTWFDQHYGGVPAWVGYNFQTQPTGFPVIDAAINGAWNVEALVWVKLLLQASIIGLAYSALYLRYARLAATGSRDELSVLASRARGTSEGKLLWRETSRKVLPIYVFTFGNTFALFILVQSLVEWYFEDIGMGSFLVQSALFPSSPSGGPPLLAVLAFLVLLLILVVNVIADAVSRRLDPRIGWSVARQR